MKNLSVHLGREKKAAASAPVRELDLKNTKPEPPATVRPIKGTNADFFKEIGT